MNRRNLHAQKSTSLQHHSNIFQPDVSKSHARRREHEQDTTESRGHRGTTKSSNHKKSHTSTTGSTGIICKVAKTLHAAIRRSLVLIGFAAALGNEASGSGRVPLVLRTLVPELSETAEHARPQVLCRPPWEGGFGVRGRDTHTVRIHTHCD